MKLISVFLFLPFAQICLAQSEAPQEVNVIDAREIFGIWTGSSTAFTPFLSGSLIQGLGSKGSKTNNAPNNPITMTYMVITPYDFTYSNYNNVKWKIVDHYLVITTEYRKEIKGFLSADSATHEYRLTFEGQIFTRHKKIEIDTEKK